MTEGNELPTRGAVNLEAVLIGELAVGTKGPPAAAQGMRRTEHVRMEHRLSCGEQ